MRDAKFRSKSGTRQHRAPRGRGIWNGSCGPLGVRSLQLCWRPAFARVAGRLLGLGGAAAQGIQFGPTGDGPGTSTTNSYDQDFVREWEANPPKGFATLAKANVEATKTAIKRYTDIVAGGGWPQLPEPPNKAPRDSLLQFGATDPSVSLLRARLAASGDLERWRYVVDELRLQRREGAAEVPILERSDADRHCRQTHHRGAERPGRRPIEAAQGQPRTPAGSGRARRPRNTWSSIFRLPRSRRCKTARSWRATQALSGSRIGRRLCCARPITDLSFQSGVAPAADGDFGRPDPERPGHAEPGTERAREVRDRRL